METSLKTGFAQILSCCPKNVSCPKFRGGLGGGLSRQFSVPISRALLYRGSVPVFQRYTKKHDFRKDAFLILASP